MKRYDAGTLLDANDRPIGHYCAKEGPCGHCGQYPFAYPRENWAVVSDKTLAVLEAHARQQIEEATKALLAIVVQRAIRHPERVTDG